MHTCAREGVYACVREELAKRGRITQRNNLITRRNNPITRRNICITRWVMSGLHPGIPTFPNNKPFFSFLIPFCRKQA